MSLAGKATQLKCKMNFSDDGSQSNQEHNYTLENAAIGAETQTTIVPPSVNNSKHRDQSEASSCGEEPLNSKPAAKETNDASTPLAGQKSESDADESLSASNSPRYSLEHRKPAPTTHVDDIAPSVLDELLYEARQYDSTLIATSGIPTRHQSSTQAISNLNMNNGQSTQARSRHGPNPFSTAGRRQGGPSQPRITVQPGNKLPAAQILPKQAEAEISQPNSGDMDTPMPDAQPPAPSEPDFSFTRPVYSDPIPPSPARKNFFRCTWRVDIPKNTVPEEGVRDAILEIWSALKDAD
jgi:hypothetical protein